MIGKPRVSRTAPVTLTLDGRRRGDVASSHPVAVTSRLIAARPYRMVRPGRSFTWGDRLEPGFERAPRLEPHRLVREEAELTFAQQLAGSYSPPVRPAERQV